MTVLTRGGAGKQAAPTAAPTAGADGVRVDPPGPVRQLTEFTAAGNDGPTPPDTTAGVGSSDVMEWSTAPGIATTSWGLSGTGTTAAFLGRRSSP